MFCPPKNIVFSRHIYLVHPPSVLAYRGGPEAQMRHHVLTEVLFELLNSFAQITDLLDHISGAQQYPVNFNDSLVKTER